MGLIQVATNTVTSAVSSVTLTGIDSDDVYMVALSNIQGSSDVQSLKVRVTASGTGQSTSNYDYAKKTLRANTTFSNNSATNQSEVFVNTQLAMGTGTQETLQGIQYLYNFNNSSEYSLITIEETANNSNGIGRQGAGVLKEAQATDGVLIKAGTGNINSGTFTLYKVV